MTNFRKYILFTLLAILSLQSAMADSDVTSNPIYKYYDSHYNDSLAAIDLADAHIDAAYAQRERTRKLASVQAATQQQLEEVIANAEIAVLKKEIARLRSVEKSIFRQVAVNRLRLGIEMPICGLGR